MDGFGSTERKPFAARTATWCSQRVEPIDGMLLLLASAAAAFGALALLDLSLVHGGF